MRRRGKGFVRLLVSLSILVASVATAQIRWTSEDKCEAFREGFRDGYCSETVYVCYPPIPPFCSESQYYSSRVAYIKGYELGLARAGVD